MSRPTDHTTGRPTPTGPAPTGPIRGRPFLSRRFPSWPARILVVLALVPTVVLPPATTEAGAQDAPAPITPDDPGGGDAPIDPASLDDRLQILDVDQAADEVALEVALPASLGRLAPVERNFAVLDGGRLVEVDVAPLDTPATVLAIDTSGSMDASLPSARRAARSFVEALPAEVPVGLISFGETVTVHREPTLDRQAILADIDGLDVAAGDTALWDALVEAAALVDGVAGDGDGDGVSVVVLSDGGNTAGAAERPDAVEALTSRSAVLYTVALASPELDEDSLIRTVDEVGGQFLKSPDPDRLDSLYTDIAGRLANRYRLTFAPTAGPDDAARTVVVSVVGADNRVAAARLTLGGGLPARPGTVPDPVPDGPGADSIRLGTVTVPPPGPMGSTALRWIGAAAVFAAAVLAVAALLRPASQIQLATATATGADRLAGLNAELGRAVDRLITRHDGERRLDARLDAAGVNLRPGELVLIWLTATSVLASVVTVIGGPLVGVLAMSATAAAVHLTLGLRAGRRRSKFADQLTETLGILTSSLRAGQSLPRAIELVANEAAAPTAEQFQRIHFEIRVGRDLTESLREVARRMQSEDLEWLAQAVDIHRELGGDLTEIMTNLAATIRERRSVARQIDALSAEGRATGWVLLGLPVLIFLVSWWRTPESIDAMVADPAGRLLLVIAVIGMLCGHLWIRQLVKLKY